MAFPNLSPSRRAYTPGDWAQQKYQAMSGAEVRIRYGDKRTSATLSLQYQNITDAEAKEFLDDYDAQFGTFRSFTLPLNVLAGWSEATFIPNVGVNAVHFRYSGPPQVQAVRPGVSNVSVELVSVI